MHSFMPSPLCSTVLLLLSIASTAQGTPVPASTLEPLGDLEGKPFDGSIKNKDEASILVPQKAKCGVGCGVGIGVGCLVAIIIFAVGCVALRRHKRKLRTEQMSRKWAAHKDLPDKPVPAIPEPVLCPSP